MHKNGFASCFVSAVVSVVISGWVSAQASDEESHNEEPFECEGAGDWEPMSDGDQSTTSDEGETVGTVDNDNDGYSVEDDCDDSDPDIHPAAFDWADDGIDQDCTGGDVKMCGADPDMSAYVTDYQEKIQPANGGSECGALESFQKVIDCANSMPKPGEFSDFLWSIAETNRFDLSCTDSDQSAQAVDLVGDLRCFFLMGTADAHIISDGNLSVWALIMSVGIQYETVEMVEGDGEDFVPAVQIPAHIEFGDFGSLTLRKAYLAATADGPNNGISDCQVCHSNPFGSYKKTVEVPTSDGSGMETLELDFLENLGFGLGPRSMPSPPTNNEPPRPNPNTYGCNSVDEQEETLKRLAKVACDIPGAKSEKERRALALAYACTQDTNKTQR